MITKEITYRIRVRVAHSDDEDCLLSMNEFSDGSEGLRKQWVERITDYIWDPQSKSCPQAIRPWDFILAPNGSVESLPVSKIEGKSSGVYPAHYRIPPTSIDSLEQQEQINRQERFAFATLLYEMGSGKKPFEWLSSEEVQQRYSKGEFPDDVKSLPPPLFITILSFWSVEFANISASHPLINLLAISHSSSQPSSLCLPTNHYGCRFLYQSTPISLRFPTHRRSILDRRSSCSANSWCRRLQCAGSARWQRSGRMAGFSRHRRSGKPFCMVPKRGYGRSRRQRDCCYGCSGWRCYRSRDSGSSGTEWDRGCRRADEEV